MSLKDRLSRQVKGLMSTLLAPAEDPRQVYADTFARQRDLLAQVRAAMDRLAAVEERLASTAVTVHQQTVTLEAEARRELESDREPMARLALQRRQVALQELRALDEQLGEIGQERQRLALSEQRLTVQIETFRAREEMIAARYSAAEAQVRLGESLGSLTHEMADLDQTLQASQRKTEQMQARAAALDELVGAGLLTTAGRPPADALERELVALDATAAVETELTALKDELARPGSG